MSADDRTGGGGDGERLASAIGWLADRVVEATADSGDDAGSGLSWDKDAGSFPPAYWHWIHLWNRYWAEHPESDTRRGLPTRGPVLSIVVPVYRPALWYFRECVQSVIDQTYQDWELCLCDDGSGDPELSGAMADLRRPGPADHRPGARCQPGDLPRHQPGPVGGHRRVRGLHGPRRRHRTRGAGRDRRGHRLRRRRRRRLHRRGQARRAAVRRFQPHFKPDWDPELLMAYPYLGHLTAVRRDVVTRIGGLRPEFDGSQDYDMMLRATELARSDRAHPEGALPLAGDRRVGGRRPGCQAVGAPGQSPGAGGGRAPAGDPGPRGDRTVPGRLPRAPRGGRLAHRQRHHPLPRPGLTDRGVPRFAGQGSGVPDPGGRPRRQREHGARDPGPPQSARIPPGLTGPRLPGCVQLGGHQQPRRRHVHVGHAAVPQQRHRGDASRAGSTRWWSWRSAPRWERWVPA